MNEKDCRDAVKKVIVDDLSDFRFRVAYLAYLDAYGKAVDAEVKKYLNQNILDLQQNKIDYETFYRNINKYRQIDDLQRQHSRLNIKTQSKSEWRNQMRKIEREKRHKR